MARILEIGELPDGRYMRQRGRGASHPGALVDGRRSLPGGRRGRLARRGGQPGHQRPGRTRWRTTARRVRALASELEAGGGPLEIEIADDPLLASYHLCALAPVGPEDSYQLLACPGPVARLDHLEALLNEAEMVLQLRLGQRRGLTDAAPSAAPLPRWAGHIC